MSPTSEATPQPQYRPLQSVHGLLTISYRPQKTPETKAKRQKPNPPEEVEGVATKPAVARIPRKSVSEASSSRYTSRPRPLSTAPSSSRSRVTPGLSGPSRPPSSSAACSAPPPAKRQISSITSPACPTEEERKPDSALVGMHPADAMQLLTLEMHKIAIIPPVASMVDGEGRISVEGAAMFGKAARAVIRTKLSEERSSDFLREAGVAVKEKK